ncbi:MAG: ankyrin repeat domain-containing protein, partial [Brevinema sp.]
MYKLLLIALCTCITNSFAQDQSIYTRFTYEQMTNIASSSRLSHRIFYTPSTGPHATWFDFVKKGDLKTIQQMVKNGQDIEVKDTNALGQTALLWASFLGYLDIVQYLVSEGA